VLLLSFMPMVVQQHLAHLHALVKLNLAGNPAADEGGA
jgi:hypothetical protein